MACSPALMLNTREMAVPTRSGYREGCQSRQALVGLNAKDLQDGTNQKMTRRPQ